MATGKFSFQTLDSGCCCQCHNPSLWYKYTYPGAIGANAPEYIQRNKEYFDNLSKGHNGGSPSHVANIATIKSFADYTGTYRG